jgi:predicted enzyme related to lactoylglutathione lyase
MNQGISTVIYPVKDLAAAKARFTRLLGMEPTSDAPYYVGWKIDGQDVGLNPHGHAQGMTGPVAYCEVADIKESLRELLAEGAESVDELRDVGGGKLIATVRDPDGNVLGLTQNP